MIENALDEKVEAKPAVDEARVEELVNERVQAALAQYRPAPQVQYVQAPVQRTSHFERVKSELAKEGIDEAAITNSARIAEAIRLDREAQTAPQSAQQIQNAFIRACEDKTEEALDVLGAPIPAFVEGGQGLKQELRNRVANLLLNDKRYAEAADKLRQSAYPPARLMNMACAEVIDKYCKAAGVSKPGGPPDLSSSKPSRTDDANDTVDDLSPSARKIYQISKNMGKPHEYAMKLAKQENRGLKGL